MFECIFVVLHTSSNFLQASLSEQIREVRKTIQKVEPKAVSSTSMDLTGDERLAKIESTHQNILQMIDDLKRRVEQLETNKQTTSAVRIFISIEEGFTERESPIPS